MTTEECKALGARVRETRLAAGLSLSKVAMLFGVSDASMKRTEEGEIRTARMESIARTFIGNSPSHWVVKSASLLRVQRETVGEGAMRGADRAGNNRGCPVCGVVTKAPRYRYLCREHRTAENMEKYKRVVGAAKPVPAGFSQALENMEKMKEMLNPTTTTIPVPLPGRSTMTIEVPAAEVHGYRIAVDLGVVEGILHTLKSETQFAGMVTVALDALGRIEDALKGAK